MTNHPLNIIIDPGHEVNKRNGNLVGTGAKNAYHDEAVYVQGLAAELRDKLIADGHSVTIIEANGKGNDPELEWVVDQVNDIKPTPDLLLSLHTDSSSNLDARGASVLYASAKGKLAAACLAAPLVKLLPGRWAATDKRTGLIILRKTKPVAVLVELGFGSNAKDRAIMQKKRSAIIAALIEGIEHYAKTQIAAV